MLGPYYMTKSDRKMWLSLDFPNCALWIGSAPWTLTLHRVKIPLPFLTMLFGSGVLLIQWIKSLLNIWDAFWQLIPLLGSKNQASLALWVLVLECCEVPGASAFPLAPCPLAGPFLIPALLCNSWGKIRRNLKFRSVSQLAATEWLWSSLVEVGCWLWSVLHVSLGSGCLWFQLPASKFRVGCFHNVLGNWMS